MNLPMCWECEQVTNRVVVVLLHGPSTPVGRLTLCTSCFETHYAPLAADRELTELLAIEDELHRAC